MVQRLPIVNSDDGTWGDTLNNFLGKEHYDIGGGTDSALNGGHKTITIRAGTAAANTAPLKFLNGGSLLTTPEVGAVEIDDAGTNGKLYATLTQASVATRLKLAAYNESAGAAGDIYYRDANGNFVKLTIGSTSDVLTVNGGFPSWAAPTGGSGLTQAQVFARQSIGF
jgi:hypothetical protein